MSKGRKASKSKGILAAVFLLPLVFIVYYFIAYSSQAITLENVNKVTVSVPEAADSVFDKQEDIDFYVGMLNGSLSINSAMRDVSGEQPVYIICNREDRAVEYKLYPSLNLSGCLLVAPEGQLYVLANETAKQLLLRDEFAYLYSEYFLPSFSVVSGAESSVILPVESEWSYYKSDGTAYNYTPSEYATGKEVFKIFKGFENQFVFSPNGESMPYDLTDVLCIAEDGTEYTLDQVAKLDLPTDTLISVSFTAKWNGRNGAQASGQAKYSFNILYDIPSSFGLLEKELQWGDVIEITASNLNDDENVVLETLLKNSGIAFSEYEEGKSIAFLPVGLENAPGEYTVDLSTNISGLNEKITVSAKEIGDWVPFNVTSDEYEEMLSPQRMEDFEKVLSDLTSNRPAENHYVYGETKLHKPVDSEPVYSFGQKVNVGVTEASGDSGERTVKGIVYELNSGTSVRSAQAGEVVFSGTLAPTGNTVVIYHGYGIYSYYYHLESSAVNNGDLVTDGQIIGTAGNTGFTNGKTVLHYALSIDGIFVDPESFS